MYLVCNHPYLYQVGQEGQWPSGLECRTGDRVVLGSSPAGGTSLRNFGNSVYPTLPVSFGGDTKSHMMPMPGEGKDPTQEVNV